MDKLLVELLLSRGIISHKSQIVHCCELDVFKLCKVCDVEQSVAMDSNLGLGITSLEVDAVGIKEALWAPILKITEFRAF